MSCNCGKKQERNLTKKIEFKNIYNGFKNLIVSNPDILTSTQKKVEFCKNCKFKKDNVAIFKHIKDEIFPEIQGSKCMLCGCSLSAKLRSDSKCPIGNF